MKKGFIKYVVSLLMLTILPVQYSCVEEIPKTMENTVFTVKLATLTMSPNSIVFNTYEESSQTATVLSNDIDWEFADVPDWITISPMSGSANADNSSTVVTINCQTNNSLHDRMAVFTFRSKDSEWNFSTAITVSQVRHIYEAIPETDSINLPWTASQAVIRVDANNDEWSATAMEDLSSWCNVSKNSDGIVLSCTQNASVQSRKGHVVIGTPDSSRTIVVVQSEIKVEVGVSDSIPESLQFSEKSGTSSLYINTHDDVHWTVTASDSWITLSPDNGTGSGTVNVSVSDNSDGPARVGTVSVKAYDYIKEIKVYQNGKYLNVTSPSLSFGSKGGEIMLSIKSNDGWKASLSDGSWMQLSEMTGNEDCDILLTVADNNSGYSRTGKVTITPNSAKPVVLNVEQAARYLAISDTSRIVFGHGGVAEKTIMVNTDGDYDVSTGCEYLDVVKEAGSFTISMNLKDPSSTVNDSVRVFLKNLSSGSMTISIPVVLYSVNRSAVDLGLRVMWATCNLGALESWEFGDYYAWGETETKTKYSWTNYKYSNGGFRKLTKYCSDTTVGNEGFTDGKSELEPEDDVAHIEWGGRWHIPSMVEINELISDCDWTWTTQNGVNGYKVTSKKAGYTDKSIFIPAGGYYSEVYSDFDGQKGAYWSSTRDTREGDYYARCMNIMPDSKSGSNHRSEGLSIRPVRSYMAQDFSKIELNLNQLELAIGYNTLLQVSATKKDGSAISFNDVKWTSSDTTVAVVSQGRVVAVGAGNCTVTATCGSLTDVCAVNVIDPDAVTREYVDLGLSVKWATFNVGAYRPAMYGDYYTWGETETYYENGYAQDTQPLWKQQYNPYGYNDWYSYKYSSSTQTSIKKYCTNPAYGYSGYSDNNVILDPDDDVAHVNWGDNWRIPTKDDFQELIDNCTMTWAVQDGVKGYLFTGNRTGYTDRSIFLPASGYRAHTSLQQLDSYGHYWTSSLYEDEPYSAGYFTFGSGSSNYYLSNGYRCYGLSVRPVYQFLPSELEEVWISPSNLQIVSGVSSVLEMRGFTKDDRSVYLRNVEWTSDNELVATVTNGKVKGLAAGTCTVTATYGGTLSASCEVTVIEVTKEMVVITDNLYVVANDYAYSTDYGDYMYGKHVSP